ncbi:MAG: hypothetical protein R2867_04805 [Caldilineaceae bacterium]
MQTMSAPKAAHRAWIGLAVLMLPTLLIVMDLTMLHLAVPHLTAKETLGGAVAAVAC